MNRMKGMALVVPEQLVTAAREVIAVWYNDESQRASLTAQFSSTGTAPATHRVANWQVVSAQFVSSLVSGEITVPQQLPEWADSELVNTAYSVYEIYDPDGVLPEDLTTKTWNPEKISLMPIAQDQRNVKPQLLAAGLQPVSDMVE